MKHAFRTVLMLIVAGNCVGLATLLASQQAMREVYPELQAWMLPVLAVLSLASSVACLALWGWRRWGFALLGTAHTIMLVINPSFSAPAAHTALGPVGLAVRAAAWWPVRQLFYDRAES